MLRIGPFLGPISMRSRAIIEIKTFEIKKEFIKHLANNFSNLGLKIYLA
jgi:hypothetical protein